jgi:MFS family permease
VERAAEHAPSPRAIRRLVAGLLPAIFLGAIDGQIVPVALLTIGRALGDVSLIAWVMAGYLVAGTVATPIYGKLSDLHGRRRILMVALGVSALGSAACAVATSMPVLIGARVLQGLGSGALFALAQAAAADVISGPERGRYQGYFSAVFATAALAAPLLGGYLTEHLSWRAVFWINLPLAALAAWRIAAVVAVAAPAPREARIDWSGAALLAAGLGVVLVALTRVGQGTGWLSRDTLGLAAVGLGLLAAWAWRESDAPEPIVPLSLFRNRVVLACCLVTALNFFVLIGCTVLLPLSMQAVGGARADEVALRLVALTLATPAGAFTAGRLMLRVPRMGAISAAGCGLASVGLLALAWASQPGTSLPLSAMVPLGFGLGMTLPAVLVAAQGAVGPAMIGVVTALVAFFRSLGGVVGIAVLTSMVMSAAGGGSLSQASADALAHAFRLAFGLAAGVSATAALVALRIRSVSRAESAASGGARS